VCRLSSDAPLANLPFTSFSLARCCSARITSWRGTRTPSSFRLVSPGVKADLARRFQDDQGRPPTAAEAAAALRAWKLEEALFREALRQGLERDDRAVRSLLIEKLRAQALLEAPKRQPTEAELSRWLDTHRGLYETPPRYVLEWLVVDRTKTDARAALGELEAKLKAGVDPTKLERPVFGANLDSAAARERLGDGLANELAALPPGQWRTAENATELLILRVKSVSGGLPEPGELRARLLVDCTAALQAEAAAAALEKLAAQYRFEESR
jgi:hypothetical protein